MVRLDANLNVVRKQSGSPPSECLMATGRFAACLPNHTWVTTGSLVVELNGSSWLTSHRSALLQLGFHCSRRR